MAIRCIVFEERKGVLYSDEIRMCCFLKHFENTMSPKCQGLINRVLFSETYLERKKGRKGAQEVLRFLIKNLH